MLETFLALLRHKSAETPDKRFIGAQGEQLAVKFLKKNGYKILHRNYRCNTGEIDIIGYDHGSITFIEVKTRFSDAYGLPELAVTDGKKRQIIKVALRYIAEKKIQGIDLRFDVVSIFYPPAEKYPTITLFKNAFTKNDLITSRMRS